MDKLKKYYCEYCGKELSYFPANLYDIKTGKIRYVGTYACPGIKWFKWFHTRFRYMEGTIFYE